MAESPRLPLRERELRLLTLGMALTLVPMATTLPPWVLGAAGLLGLWRLLAGRRWRGEARRLRIPATWLRFPLAVGFFGGIYLEYGSLNGIEPGSALLVALCGLKLLETRSARDGLVLALLGFLLMLAVFLHNQDLPVVLWLTPVMVFHATVLLRMSRIGPPDPLRQDLRLAGRILAQALPVALILFALFPRVPGPLWGTPEPDGRATTGLSDRMSPGSISELASSNELAFRVRFDGETPAEARQYWRGPVFERFDGREWREAPADTGEPVLLPVGEAVGQQISLEPHDQDWLLALDYPSGDIPDGAYQRSDFRLATEDPVRERTRYAVTSRPVATLEPELPGDLHDALTELPAGNNPRTRELGETLAAEHDGDPAAIIEGGMSWIREREFEYTLEPPTLGEDSMDEFLFETRSGFCEHYASAYAVMMRAAGVPSRIVTGYLGLEENPHGDHYRVRQSEAHAWTEVWLEGEGWQRVDPTGAVAPDRIDRGAASTGIIEPPPDIEEGLNWQYLQWQVQMGWDIVQARWDGWFLAYDPDQQERFLERLGLPGGDALRMALAMILLTGVGLAAVLLLPKLRPAGHGLSQRERAWQELQRRARRAGLARHPGEGPRDWGRRLWTETPGAAREIDPLIRQIAAARYGREENDGRELLRAVRRVSVARLRRAAGKGAGPPTAGAGQAAR